MTEDLHQSDWGGGIVGGRLSRRQELFHVIPQSFFFGWVHISIFSSWFIVSPSNGWPGIFIFIIFSSFQSIILDRKGLLPPAMGKYLSGICWLGLPSDTKYTEKNRRRIPIGEHKGRKWWASWAEGRSQHTKGIVFVRVWLHLIRIKCR